MKDNFRLPETGYVRAAQLVGPGGPLPFGRSTLYAKIASAEFPAPQKISERITAFRVEAVREWLADPMGWPHRQNARLAAQEPDVKARVKRA